MIPLPPNDRGRRVLAEGRYVRLVSQAGWEWAERVRISGVVAIVAVTADRELVLTEQYRRPIDARVLDLPAGLAGDVAGAEKEPLLEAARRELLEETGFVSERWTCLTEGPSSPGMTNEMLTFYLAQNAVRTAPGGGDASEQIEVHLVPLEELHSWVEAQRSGGILVDLKVYAGAYFAANGRD